MDARYGKNIYLGPELREWLDAEAKRQDRPASRIIREALLMYRSARNEDAFRERRLVDPRPTYTTNETR